MRSSLQHPFIQFLGLLLIIWWMLPDGAVFDKDVFVGAETRDLFDHIALLDQWGWHTNHWNYPNGGALIPPDIFSMLFALPWWWLERGVAYDMAIVTHLFLNGIAGWYLARSIGGSPIVGGIAVLASPFLIGQVNSGETETIGLWGIIATLTLLVEQRWRWAGFMAILTAIGSWYYGSYIAIILGLWTLTHDIRIRQLKATVGLGIFILGIALPALLYANMLSNPEQMFRGPTMWTYLTEQPRALLAFSSDPTRWLSEVPPDATHFDALGWTAPLLALWGLFQQSNKPLKLWVALLIGSLLLSLGPRLHYHQEVIWEWMPYDLLLWIPPLDSMRLPHRWMAVGTVALSVLISLGGKSFPLLACFFLLGDSVLFVPPIQSTELRPSPITERFTGPVLQRPARTMEWDARGRYLVMQRNHGQPIPYSLLMQGWSDTVSQEPLILAFTTLDSQDPIASRTVEARQFRQEDFALSVNSWGGFKEDSPQSQTRSRLQSMGFTQLCYHRSLVSSSDRIAMEILLTDTLGEPDFIDSEAWLWNL